MKKLFFVVITLSVSIFYSPEASAIGIGISGMKKDVKSIQEIRKENIVSQSLDFSCGPASMATMLSYYFDDEVTEEEIINFLLLTTDLEKVKERKGFSLLDLKNFAKHRGYEVVGYKMDMEYLASLKKPVLVPIDIKDYSHFVIFRGTRGNRVFLADPSMGNMTMRVEEFEGIWTKGIGMVLSKDGEETLDTPLKLTEKEKAVAPHPDMLKSAFSTGVLGKIYGAGEF